MIKLSYCACVLKRDYKIRYALCKALNSFKTMIDYSDNSRFVLVTIYITTAVQLFDRLKFETRSKHGGATFERSSQQRESSILEQQTGQFLLPQE